MGNNGKTIHSDCRVCCRSTRHDVLCFYEEQPRSEYYNETYLWQVVQCRGCDTVGFRLQNDDYEQISVDPDGDAHHTIHISNYPRVLRDHVGLSDGIFWVPNLIAKVYRQTLSAYGEKAYVLASIGLRATIEAVCNHLKISGATLEKRIDQLFKGGYVSNEDKKRLHAIRFLGNDAAHEVKEPSEADLRVALEIVEHLLNSVFILARKAKSLQTVIESYEEFEQLIGQCAKAADPLQTLSLGALLGSNRRFVGNNLDAFEVQLKDAITTGKVTFLTLGQENKVAGKDVQFYGIGDTSKIKKEIDEDLPF